MRPNAAVVLTCMILLGCDKQPAEMGNSNDMTDDTSATPSTPAQLAAVDPKLAAATNRFGFDLFESLNQGNPTASTMVSPPSVAMALAMTYNGADGETQAAMARALEVEGFSLDSLNAAHRELRRLLEDPRSDITLAIANSLWARQGMAFEADFLNRNREYFAAEVNTLDFANPDAPQTINRWVGDKTRGKIPTIIDQIPGDAILYLINAIYFKGIWTYQFDKSKSYDSVFHHPSGDKRRTFMLMESDLSSLAGEGFQAVRLPYGKSQRFGMYIFLPDTASSMETFAGTLTPEKWREWMGQFGKRAGELRLPRYTLTYKEKLNDALSTAGMEIAFDPARADFSKLIKVANENVYISAVNHKTFMEVNEEGTEAAAVTSVEVVVTSVREPQERFIMTVDRPFFCAIVDRDSGLILFMGTVYEFE